MDFGLAKKFIVCLILTSFLTVAFFSFAVMTYSSDGSMAGDCPLSTAMGASLCPQDVFNIAVHHISAYYSFFNILISLGALIGLIFFASLYSFSPPSLAARYHTSPPLYSRQRKKVHWLALLENSR
jgi:hypothetical protein